MYDICVFCNPRTDIGALGTFNTDIRNVWNKNKSRRVAWTLNKISVSSGTKKIEDPWCSDPKQDICAVWNQKDRRSVLLGP
jgi:hypothetical protein